MSRFQAWNIESRYSKWILGIILLFAIGLVGFYEFSANKGDGLEVTMKEAEVEEGEAVWSAPLDYGEDYQGTLVRGLVGFGVVLGLALGYGLHTRQRKDAPA